MQNRKLFRLLVAVSLASVVGIATALAQVTTGTILGVVQDATGGKLPGASVEVKNLQTGTARTAVTDEQGRYRAPNLAVGTYEVTASLPGFKTEVRSGIELTIGREAVMDFTLAVGAVAEKVEVTGEVPLVETTNAVVGAIVDEKQIRDLPLNGRDLTQLTLLTPGVMPSRFSATRASNGFGTKLSIAGGRPQSSSFLLDGTDINANSNNTPGSVAGVQLGVDTIQEFRVITNPYSAEYGRAGAGVVSSITRSGTNQFHGSAFEYLRNDKLDARNFFDGAQKPAFKRNQFGASAGGPIQKSRTFFFGSYEGLRQRLGITQIANVPTQAARDGILPTQTVTVISAVKPYLALYPLPNGRNLGDGRGEFRGVVSQPTGEDYWVARMDHTFSERNSLYGRYTFDDGRVNTPESPGNVVDQLRSRNQYLTVEEKKLLGAKAFNVFRFAYNRTNLSEIESPLVDFRNLFFIPEVPIAMPVVGVTGLQSLLGTGTIPKIYYTQLFQFMDDFMYQRGGHSIKAGINVERILFDLESDFNAGGAYSFQNLANFLRNIPQSFTVQFPTSDTVRNFRSSVVAAYLQDDLKLSSKLTVNLGLRYEFPTDPNEVHGKVAHLPNILAPNASLKDITTGGPVFHAPKKNVAPRVGLAWSPLASGKTVVRAGFGVFFDLINNAYYQTPSARMPPFFQSGAINSNVRAVLFPNWRDMGIAPASQPQIEDFPRDPNAPYYVRHSVNLEQQFTPTTVVSITYTGANGIHLMRHIGVDLAAPIIQADGSRFYPSPGQLRNPNFGSIRFKLSDGTSSYHGVAMDVRKRWSAGFQFQAALNISRSLDDGPAAAGNADFGGDNVVPREFLGKDRGRSPWDIGHSLVVNMVADLPFGAGKRWWRGARGVGGYLASGWQAGSLITVADGNPFSALLGFIPPGFIIGTGDQTDYPNLVAGASGNPVLGGPDHYFDAKAFSLPAPGRVGNLGRNTLEAPGLATVDLSVAKNNRIAESKTLQFRAEAFNLFNRANFGLPQNNIFASGSTVPRADAGRIITTTTPSRQLQFSLRFVF